MASNWDVGVGGIDPIAMYAKNKKLLPVYDKNPDEEETQENAENQSPWNVQDSAPKGNVGLRNTIPGVSWNPNNYTANLPGGYTVDSNMGTMVNDQVQVNPNLFSTIGMEIATRKQDPVTASGYAPYQEFMTGVNRPTSDLLATQKTTYDPSKVSMTEKVDKANTAYAPATEYLQGLISSVPTADIEKYTQMMNRVYAPAREYLEANRPTGTASQQKRNANIAMVDAAGETARQNLATQRGQAMESASGSAATRGLSTSPLALYLKSKAVNAYAPAQESLERNLATQKQGFVANAEDSSNAANNNFTTAIGNILTHSGDQAVSAYGAEDARNNANKAGWQTGLGNVKKAVGETATGLYNNEVSWKQGETSKVLGAERDLSEKTASGALGLYQADRTTEANNNKLWGQYYMGIPKDLAAKDQQAFENTIKTDVNDRAQGAETRAQTQFDQGNMTLGELGLNIAGLPSTMTLNQANSAAGLMKSTTSSSTQAKSGRTNEMATVKQGFVNMLNQLIYGTDSSVTAKYKNDPKGAYSEVMTTVRSNAGKMGLSNTEYDEIDNMVKVAAGLQAGIKPPTKSGGNTGLTPEQIQQMLGEE